MNDFLLVVIFFLHFSLSLPTKVHTYPLFFSFFNYILGPSAKVFDVFNSIIELQFIIDYCFQFDFYSFDF